MHKYVLILVLAICPLTAAAQTQTPQDRIISLLDSQGFEIQKLSRTLLGRVRVISVSEDLRRETVFNPATGHILRDILRPLVRQDGFDSESEESENNGGLQGNEDLSDDDEEEDEPDDESDEEDDESDSESESDDDD